MSNGSSSNEETLARWIECVEVIARAAKHCNFSGSEMSAASLFYWVSSMMTSDKSLSEALICAQSVWYFLDANRDRFRVIDVDDVKMH